MRTPDNPGTELTTLQRDDIRTRMRLLGVLFFSAAMNRTGFIAVFTVTALAAEDILGSARWSGLAAAMGTLGLAAGTTPLAALMARRGRRPGIVLGLAVAVVGAGIAAYGVRASSFLVLLAGMWIFGFGNSGDRLGRCENQRLRNSSLLYGFHLTEPPEACSPALASLTSYS